MPFTLAHPIASAPIWFGSHKKLDLASLFIGTMIPDLEYFLALQPTRNIGHTLLGVVIQGLPCSIALLLFTRYFLMQPLLALLPLPLAQKLPRLKDYFPLQLGNLINVVLSIVIGALSHIVWDEFTHKNGWFVTRSILLRSQVGPLPVFKFLQYGGGILGMIALLVWLGIWLRQNQQLTRTRTLNTYWKFLAVFVVTLCAATVAGIAMEMHRRVGDTTYELVIRAVIGCISGLFLGLSLYSALFWVMRGKFWSSQ
jgi:hypothetical protein